MEFIEKGVKEAIDGDREALWSAFVWGESPQGNDYWWSQALGETPIDVDYLKSLLGEDEKEKEMIGTLKELGVKPGDVVAIYNEYHRGKEVEVDEDWTSWCGRDEKWWKLISRGFTEPETPKTWGEMTDVEKGSLLLAKHEGKVIERLVPMCDRTGHVTHHEWASYEGVISADYAYRIKPEPKRETRNLYVYMTDSDYQCTKIGTIDLIDGKPDFNSIKKGKNK